MNNLSKELKDLIYSYDNTYHEIYKNVLKDINQLQIHINVNFTQIKARPNENVYIPNFNCITNYENIYIWYENYLDIINCTQWLDRYSQHKKMGYRIFDNEKNIINCNNKF